MAEQVNQRIENAVNELEQMQRTSLYTADEIREISRKRKELEYRLQRRTKEKEDFTQYIAYDMALLEDISLRRKQMNFREKKNEIEYAIARRLNKVFKQFIYRFQNDIEIYFQYIKFCMAVNFEPAISAIITQMLQIYGDKPKTWQLAAKWEFESQNSLENAKRFLLQGIQRHPDAEILYLELMFMELTEALQAADDEELRDKMLQRANIVWKNAIKRIQNEAFHSKLCKLIEKFDVASEMYTACCDEYWIRHSDCKEAWIFVATDELEGNKWEQLDEFVTDKTSTLPERINRFTAIYESAIEKFSDESLSTSFIHSLLKLNEDDCSSSEKVELILNTLDFCHRENALSPDFYGFWIDMLEAKGDSETSELSKILDEAAVRNPKSLLLWEKKLLLSRDNEAGMLSIIDKAKLSTEHMTHLWSLLLDNVADKTALRKLYEKCKKCDNIELIKLKPKFLQLCNELNGLKQCIALYDDLVKTPPIQLEIHEKMLDILLKQEQIDVKNVRKCFEFAVRDFGKGLPELWMKYIEFEFKHGSPKLVSSIYQKAVAMLERNVVDEFIKEYMLRKNCFAK